MKVVIALAPVWDSVTPPLALAFLKSSITKAGYDCKCIDFSVQFRPIMVSALGDFPAEEYVASHPDLYKNWAQQICRESPDVVGFSILGSNIRNTSFVAKEVKKLLPDVVIVSGGPSLTRQNEDTLEHAYSFSDYIIEGEGENIFVDFLKCIEVHGDVTKVKQLWLKAADGSLYYTGVGVEQNIDTIPLPDFTDFDRAAYPCPDRLPMLFSRGCILNCNYCENKWNHLTQRSRSGNLVFEELKRNVNEYGIKEYMFNDDSLISFKTFKQLEEYCDLTISENLILPWSVYGTRVERKLTDAYVNKLRRSGMDRVSLGVESFSSRVQHEMGKSSLYDDADKVCRMFANQGIKTESWIIYGYPTESDADFNDTLQWFIKNPNVLSHVTANAFGPNAKYRHDKPNMIHFPSNRPWDWFSTESTIEKRKQRFLLLIDVLETIRKSRKGNFTFHFGDPLYVKYFSSWSKEDKSFLFDQWKQLEEFRNEATGIKKIFRLLGIEKKKKRVTVLKPKYIWRELVIDGSTDELQERLLERIKNYLMTLNNKSAEEQQKKLEEYRDKMQETYRLSSTVVSEDEFYALALDGPLDKMLDDLDSITPKELSKRLIQERVEKYGEKSEAV